MQALFPATGTQGAQTLPQVPLLREVLRRIDIGIGVHRGHAHSFGREVLPGRSGRRCAARWPADRPMSWRRAL
jgi:hypothetical protein